MSTIDSEDRYVTGYFLPEDTQLRLKQLREYVGFLTNLARPRRPDEDSECYNEIRPGEVAICFELIEEQIGLVLDELSWPGERGEPAEAAEAAADTETETEAADPDGPPRASEADAAKPEPAEVDDAEADETEAAEVKADGAAARYVYGLTMDQIDEINRLLEKVRAYGDVVIASDGAEFASCTLSLIGDSIFHDAIRLREILWEVGAQHLDPARGPRTGVREEHATYLALPTRLPMSSGAHVVPEHPTYQ
ncbi:XAC0095 family protein [Dyella sp.]|uniref:XAC0095 family protein n=1 Tax=Dyella sp. TaxID=1869338 RepID=UPI003F81D81C